LKDLDQLSYSQKLHFREQKLQWAKLLLGICEVGGRAQEWRENGGLDEAMGTGGSAEQGAGGKLAAVAGNVGGKLAGAAGNVGEAGAVGFIALLFKIAKTTPLLERVVTGTLDDILFYVKEQNSASDGQFCPPEEEWGKGDRPATKGRYKIFVCDRLGSNALQYAIFYRKPIPSELRLLPPPDTHLYLSSLLSPGFAVKNWVRYR
jgi:hypothetical protein